MCRTCAESHITSQCNTYRTTRCTNCRSNGHTSWSRKCPEFIRRCDLLDEKFPENKMPYFPTNAAWTHTIVPPKPNKPRSPTRSPTPPQASHPAKLNRTLRQTTIAFPMFPRPDSPPTPPLISHPNSPALHPTANDILNEIYLPLNFDIPNLSTTSASSSSASSKLLTSSPKISSPSPSPTHV